MTGFKRGFCVLVCSALLVSCQTSKEPEPAEEPVGPASFQPASYVSQIRLEEGRYPNLFSPDSYAVWVGPEVTALKRDRENAIDPDLEEAATEIDEEYIVFECHIGSVFGDTSIAYDVVGFRGIEVYLRTPDERRIRPIQLVIDLSVEEEQREALKMFRRTNLVIFPRHNLLLDAPTIGPKAASVRLVLEGHNSSFYFEWPGVKTSGDTGWRPSDSEVLQAVRLGFNELYRRIQRLSRKFY